MFQRLSEILQAQDSARPAGVQKPGLKRNLVAVAVAIVAACDGPHEDAGERADVVAGTADSVHGLGQGPAERAGEKRDEAEWEKQAE